MYIKFPMDKKHNEIHKNLIPTKINKHTVYTQQVINLIAGQPSYLPSWIVNSGYMSSYEIIRIRY